MAGLEKLEYRGYDSAGLSLIENGSIESVRAVGNLAKLRERINGSGSAASSGIGHTRWATHGRVTEANCHPHDDDSGRVHVVMNGIVENWADLKADLVARGRALQLGDRHRGDRPPDRRATTTATSSRPSGAPTTSCAATTRSWCCTPNEPDVLVGARKECPLVVGVGDGENFIASAIPAFLADTRRIQLVEDGEIVVVTPEGTRFLDASGAAVEREVQEVDWDEDAAEKGGYETFMLKEIHEQPDAVAETVADRLAHDDVELAPRDQRRRAARPAAGGDRGLRHLLPRRPDRPLRDREVVARAGGDGRGVGVPLPRPGDRRARPRDRHLPVRARRPTRSPRCAWRARRARRCWRSPTSWAARPPATPTACCSRAPGLEIGVAATKTFVAQVAAMYLFALKLAKVHDSLEPEVFARLVAELKDMSHRIEELLASVDAPVRAMAEHWRDSEFFLYLGRNVGLAVALEGALKLKEISYVPTDAYAAGEMKHGPIALLDELTPVVCVATESPVLDKVLSNVSEVRARGAHVLAVATEGNPEVAGQAEEVVYVPRTDWLLQPLLAVIPLQLLAYYIARERGLNVDQPRNLAKTVTVE